MTPERAHDPIRFWSRLVPSKTAIADRSRAERISYRALDESADRWAAFLHARGIRRGERVAVLSMNRIEVVALFYGCARIGAALVPLNWRLAPAELAPIIADARVALLVGEARFGEHRAVGANAIPWCDLDADIPVALDAVDAPALAAVHEMPGASTEDAAMILYTSGTTGRPKGAILSHRQVLFNAIATVTAWGLGIDDIAPISTPFFHTGGWNVFGTTIWQCGGTAVMFEAFDPRTFLDALDAEGCTVAFGVPTQFVMLVDSAAWGRPLQALRWFISGGAPCPAPLAARIRAAGYRLREGFGLTEFGPNCFAISEEQALAKPGSVGWPVPFVEMRLVDDEQRPVPIGATGELQLRGPQLFSGYLFDPVRSAEALTTDGWFRTGDLASRDADGAYTIRGRRKDMFISGGENVYPGEVEAALVGCDGVAEAVVIGVPHEIWGEVGHAFVQPRPGASLDVQQLIATLRDRLAHYKVPKSIECCAELPRIGSGKVDRSALRQRTREGVR